MIDGLAESEFHDDPKIYFRQHYFEALDLAVNCIKDRFDQPGCKVYSNLEQLLLKVIEGSDVTTEVDCEFYKDDIDSEMLKAQLHTFRTDL